MSLDKFYWDPDHPQSWFSKLEVQLSGLEHFDEHYILELATGSAHEAEYKILFNLCLFVAAKSLTKTQFQIFVSRFINQEKQCDIAKKLKITQPYVSLVVHNCMKKIKKEVKIYMENRLMKFEVNFAQVLDSYINSMIELTNLEGSKTRINDEVMKIKNEIVHRVMFKEGDYIKNVLLMIEDITKEMQEDVSDKCRKYEVLQQFGTIIKMDLDQSTIYQTYREAKEAIKLLPIKVKTDYLKKYKLDLRLPKNPQEFYKDKGWVNWREFLKVDNNDL